MAKLIDTLPTPTVVTGDFGNVTLTHKAYGFRIVPWDTPRVVSFTVLGAMKDGKFRAYPGTEQRADWKASDIQAIDWDTTLPQVMAQHDIIVTRAPGAG